MNNQPSHSNPSEEIDLGFVLKKFNAFFKKTIVLFFEVIAFFLKFKIIVIALIVIGVAYGYYKDKTSKRVFYNEAIVIPNFESVDYMYDKVNALNQKIEAKDTVFLKTFFGTNYRSLRKIELEPIVDIYNFVSKSRENIDIFRIFVQSQDLQEYMEEFSNSKYYKYHKLSVRTSGENSSQHVIPSLMTYMNDNEHYNEYAAIYKENIQQQVREHEKMLKQIDTLIHSISNSFQTASAQGVNIVESSNLHFLLERKRDLLDEKLAVQMQLVDYDATVKLVNVDYNLEKEPFLPAKAKYPIYLILLFSAIFFIMYIFKKLKEIAES